MIKKCVLIYVLTVLIHSGTICGFGWDFLLYAGRTEAIVNGAPISSFMESFKPPLACYMLMPGSWFGGSLFVYFGVFLFWIGFCGVVLYYYGGLVAWMLFNSLTVLAWYQYNSLLGILVYFSMTCTLLSMQSMFRGRYLFAGIFAGLCFCTRLYLTGAIIFFLYALHKRLLVKDLYLFGIGFLAVFWIVFIDIPVTDIYQWLVIGNLRYVECGGGI